MKKIHHFNVRIEGWDKNGNSLGWRSHSIFNSSIDDAIQEGRDMYKKLMIGAKKQITISNELGERVWRFHKGVSGYLDSRGNFVN